MSVEQPESSDVTPVGTLTYEQARDELRSIVQSLETGSAPLEETLRLWQRGEELSRHCQHILQKAQKKMDEAVKVEVQSPGDDVQ